MSACPGEDYPQDSRARLRKKIHSFHHRNTQQKSDKATNFH